MLSRRAPGIVILAAVLSLAAVHAPRSDAAPLVQKEREGTALVYGSVFSEEGLALRGAQILVRHKKDKKPKWKARSNSRGEFAVRLPRASGEYVLTIRAQSYAEESREFKVTLEEQFDFYFRMKHPKPEGEEEEEEKEEKDDR